MDPKGGAQPPLSSLEVRWNNYKRSAARSTRVWSCPKCHDRRAFHRESELFTHVAQHHPEFADCSREDQLNNEQWQALIALHRTLLHEHHDFFLASQHPSANPALRRLVSKYAMPARMWRHGIHSFLELL